MAKARGALEADWTGQRGPHRRPEPDGDTPTANRNPVLDVTDPAGADPGAAAATAVAENAPIDAPTLTGLTVSAAFGENDVNATARVLDADVTFDDVDGDFDGGLLTLTGLLAEDTVSVRNEGTDPGQIGLSGSDVTFGGVVVGTLAGGAGATLTITFNAAATSAAIDALIQNLTYANSSDSPTASRDLVLNVTDAGGAHMGPPPAFQLVDPADNPFAGLDVGSRAAPAFADMDGDGDLDMVSGEIYGTLRVFQNDGGVFNQVAPHPFNGLTGGYHRTPAFADLDGDGDLDMVTGEFRGTFRFFDNDGGAFTERTGAANPFAGIDVGSDSSPTFVDLDADGDLDLVSGEIGGALLAFRNDGGVFNALVGAANPFGGIDAGDRSAPAFLDIDGDLDLDLIIGESGGTLRVFDNNGGVFTELVGAANPFAAIDVGDNSKPTVADVDGDGDQDLIVGGADGRFTVVRDTNPHGQIITVTVTAVDDAPTGVGLPAEVTVIEDLAFDFDLSALSLSDVDTFGSITVTLTADAGTLAAADDGGVTVAGTGTGVLTLSGTVAAIHAFLNTGSAIRYLGAPNASGDDADTVTVTVEDGSSAVTLGVVNVDITSVPDAPALTGLPVSVALDEQDVNGGPQLLGFTVDFIDPDDNFDGGTLTLIGLLAEDTVSVRNEGTDPGQIGLAGADVSFGGVVIGTLAGGVGGTLTITFNADATSVAIDALIQNLTYANASDAPTASRDLLLNVTDAAGAHLDAVTVQRVFAVAGPADNPFAGLDVGSRATPVFVDLDGDGDLDLVSGEIYGTIRAFQNDGGVFTPLMGAANPFNRIDEANRSAPAFVDFDNDGDLDMVSGDIYGALHAFRNDGGVFNPMGAHLFNGFNGGYHRTPAFVDLDGDGDLDLVVGEYGGTFRVFHDTGAAFMERTGAANPFAGIDVGNDSSPAFLDFDADGDLDLVSGEITGALRAFRNDGGVFTELVGAANPFAGIDVGDNSTPTAVDINGDGDLDLVVGGADGGFTVVLNTTLSGRVVTVNVTPHNEAPVEAANTGATVREGGAVALTAAMLDFDDPDSGDAEITYTLTSTPARGVLRLDGVALGLGDSFTQQDLVDGRVNFVHDGGETAGSQFGFSVSDGAGGEVTGQTFAFDVTPVSDAPTLTGLETGVSFDWSAAHGAAQVLDFDVAFGDVEGDLEGGRLTLSGPLAEDVASVRNEGAAAGQIGLSGSDVTFGGVVIGTLAGGTGVTLTVTFNAAATVAAVEALIQNLTYANASRTPTAERDLVLNVTDGAGADLGAAPGRPVFFELASHANPFNAIDVGQSSTPALADLDGDGDLDLVVGETNGALRAFDNDGGVFTELLGAANPLGGIVGGSDTAPTFADLDGDGDLDLVMAGAGVVWLRWFDNHAGVFSERVGAANPLAGIPREFSTAPTFVDLDGDDDLDLVVGGQAGTLKAYYNDGGTFIAPATNPFAGIDVGSRSKPAFADLDGDGDLDLVVGENGGTLKAFANDGGVFSQLVSVANPFDGLQTGGWSAPTFADLDRDGDLDLVVGNVHGTVSTLLNTTPHGRTITVALTDLPLWARFNETDVNVGPRLLGLEMDIDPGADLNGGTMTLSGLLGEDVASVRHEGTAAGQIGVSGADVTFGGVVIGSLAGGGGAPLTVTFNGVATAAAVEALIRNLSYANASDLAAAERDLSLTVTDSGGADVGAGAVITVYVDSHNDAPVLTGLEVSVAFDENDVNATARVLDADVTFAETDSGFDGGRLTMSGLLAGDVVSVRDEGAGAGQIGLSGADVTFGGVIIGTLTGGAGSTLTITFNGDATVTGIQALVRNLTYAHTSGDPAASRNLVLNITDAGGADLVDDVDTFAPPTGPVDLFGPGVHSRVVSFVDLDGDGDLDAVGGHYAGALRTFENTAAAGQPAVFTELTGAANPFDGLSIRDAAPSFLDLDGDGDLDAVVGTRDGILRSFENRAAGGQPAAFVELTGAANPFDGVDVGGFSAPAFADLDGDGDLDALVGDYQGRLHAFRNTAPAGQTAAFSAMTGSANPFDGLDLSVRTLPSFVDMDRDGDLDLALGEVYGPLRLFENRAASQGGPAVFAELTGAANPFDPHGVRDLAAAAFVDLDSDGDLDLVASDIFGQFFTFLNTTPRGQTITVTVNAENDAPVEAANTGATLLEGGAGGVTAAMLDFADAEQGDAAITYTLTSAVSNGVLRLDGVPLGLGDSFTQQDLVAGRISFVHDGGETTQAQFGFTVGDGQGGEVVGQTFTFDVDPVNDAPTVTGLPTSAGFDEQDANAAPQLLGFAIAIADVEGNFDGGTLTVSGLLAEDIVGVSDAGVGPGQIGLDGADVTFGGVVIGVLSGGAGATLTVTFNAAATPTAIEAMVQGLTYANSSDTPTASRDLLLNLTDADGADLGAAPGPPTFATGNWAGNPFNGVDVGWNSAPSFVDLDGDGDLDAVVGAAGGAYGFDGTLRAFENTAGPGQAAAFTELTGVANPFDGITGDQRLTPAFADLDGDGDLDLVMGDYDGALRVFENTAGVGHSAAFSELTGAANPFNGVDVDSFSAPSFADLDGDGDLDAVVGGYDHYLRVFENTAAAGQPATFAAVAAADSPFAALPFDHINMAVFGDVDGDGDLDALVGEVGLVLYFLENTAESGQPAAFTQRTGAANPFAGATFDWYNAPALADLDGDGDLDLVAGGQNGALTAFLNTTPHGRTVAVTVAAADDAPTAADDAFSVTESGVASGSLFLDNGSGPDADPEGDALAVTEVNGSAASVGTQIILASGALLTVHADGTYSYDPNGAFDGVPGPGSGAAAAATDTFTYSVAGGATATVTVTIIGEDSADVAGGTGGDDALYGGDGDDVLAGGGGTDLLDGGAGVDTADYAAAASRVIVRLFAGLTPDDGDGAGDTLVSLENAIGSAFNDTLIGSSGANVLSGGAGQDYLIGLGGNDILFGGIGSPNQLQGGAGDDDYHVDANDTLVEFAGEGHDRVFTAQGRLVLAANLEDLTYVGAGDFTGIGNAGANRMTGGAGDDTLSGRGGADTLDGGAGLDTADYSLAASGVTAFLDGTDSDDGDGGIDILTSIESLLGSAFGDLLHGSVGNNVLDGGEGDDIVVGRGGNDTLRGGGGVDLADYGDAASGVFVKLNIGRASDGEGGTDTLISIEDVDGSLHNDVLVGSAGNNTLFGLDGSDYLVGLAGDDELWGGAGAPNQLQGGLGDDRYRVDANDTLIEFADEGYDSVFTTLDRYTLRDNFEALAFDGVGDFVGVGNDLDNVIHGGSGDDTLTGGGGDDVLFGAGSSGSGGSGFDTVALSGVLTDYVIEDLGDGEWSVTDTIAGRDGVDLMLDIAQLRFSDGSTFALISSSSMETADDALVLPGLPGDVRLGKGADSAQVLPGLATDEFLLSKDVDVPLVLPGGDPFGVLDTGERLETFVGSATHMLTLDAEGGFIVGLHDPARLHHPEDGQF